MLAVAVSLITVHAVAGGDGGAWFETIAARINTQVAAKYNTAKVAFKLMEADVCPRNPTIHPVPGGCMVQDQVTALQEMDYLHLIYTPINLTVPSVEVHYTISTQNTTFLHHTDPRNPLIGDDTEAALPTSTADGHTTMEGALALINKLPTANRTVPFKFNTVNYRYPVQPCVTEPVVYFTDSFSPVGGVGFLVVGATTGAVCKTPITKLDTRGSFCGLPMNKPQCYPRPA